MDKKKHLSSFSAKFCGVIGLIIGLLIGALLTENVIVTLIVGYVFYRLGKKVGAWISYKTATAIAVTSGVVFVSLRFLGFKVFEVAFEKLIETFMF